MNGKLENLLSENGWRVCSEDEQRGEVCAEIEKYSPAGEDFIAVVWYDGTAESFVAAFREYANDFDADEHAEMWIKARDEGVSGVPSRIRDLIDDADEIKNMLLDMSDALEDALNSGVFSNADLMTEEEIRADWETALDSDMDYSEIAAAVEWGFDRHDMECLIALHAEGKNRAKIEALLTDCNFHRESDALSQGDYQDILRPDIWGAE